MTPTISLTPMRRKVCVASLFFNPSFVSQLAGFGKAFRDLGADVAYVLHRGYRAFGDLPDIAPVHYYDQIAVEELKQFTHCVIYNAAIHNPMLAKKMKRNGTKIAYVYHEPSVPWVKVWGKLTVSNIARLAVSRVFTHRTLGHADLVILPSKEAWCSYGNGEIKYNKNVMQIPLVFDDGYLQIDRQQRVKFSYVGTISRAHAFDQFTAFMNYALERELGIEFLIASRHEVPDDAIPGQYRSSVELRCGRALTSKEINECYAQSICVWNVYRHSTQSGVMANAFMCGAPVIASRKGAFLDFVQDGYNGKFADEGDFAQIAGAFEEIARRVELFSENSRETFLRNFHYKAQLPRIETILALS